MLVRNSQGSLFDCQSLSQKLMPCSQNCSPNSHRKHPWNVLRVFDVNLEIKSDFQSYFGFVVVIVSEISCTLYSKWRVPDLPRSQSEVDKNAKWSKSWENSWEFLYYKPNIVFIITLHLWHTVTAAWNYTNFQGFIF